MSAVYLQDLIAPRFHDLRRMIQRNEKTHYWLKGGRGSTKSSFVSLQIALGILLHPDAHAIIYRKHGNNLKDSVFNQMLWALEKLKVSQYFAVAKSPLKLTYKPTGQQIIFRGMDDPMKSKSIKMPFGYFRFAWFEELDQFDGIDEIETVTRSIMRGGDRFSYFYSYNPPETQSNWVNAASDRVVKNRHVHTSSYIDVPREWLGEQFFIEADLLKERDELKYKHVYLGEVTGTGGAIFRNLTARKITDDEIGRFWNIRNGIDWGFAVDPFAFVRMHYDKKKRTLYIFDELHEIGMLDNQAVELIREKGLDGHDLITADSAEPKSIAEFNSAGMYVEGAVKGRDSVNYGIKWLRKQLSIVIDPERCPNTWREFSMYEFEKTKTGNFRRDYPDKDNHTIDAVRYAMESDMEGVDSGSGVLF